MSSHEGNHWYQQVLTTAFSFIRITVCQMLPLYKAASWTVFCSQWEKSMEGRLRSTNTPMNDSTKGKLVENTWRRTTNWHTLRCNISTHFQWKNNWNISRKQTPHFTNTSQAHTVNFLQGYKISPDIQLFRVLTLIMKNEIRHIKITRRNTS